MTLNSCSENSANFGLEKVYSLQEVLDMPKANLKPLFGGQHPDYRECSLTTTIMGWQISHDNALKSESPMEILL